MIVAIWIIAVCEVLRMLQNFVQIGMMSQDKEARDNAYAEFVKSLKHTDREFVEAMLKEFAESEDKMRGSEDEID